MDEQRAREILGDWVQSDDASLHGAGVYWSPSRGELIELDSQFSADELEAIAWWIRNQKAGQK